MESLTLFKDHWSRTRTFKPPKDTVLVTQRTGVIGSILFRDGKHQVQLFSVLPFVEIPDHFHPGMDSYELFIGGSVEFRARGRSNKQLTLGDSIRILPHEEHGGTFGELGGMFLSIQEWQPDVEITSASENWYPHFTKEIDNEQQPKTFKFCANCDTSVRCIAYAKCMRINSDSSKK